MTRETVSTFVPILISFFNFTQLINAWIEVFRHVVGKVKTSYVQQVALKPIQELLNKKHAAPKRRKGIELATAMAMNVK